ncbi:MAG TPA: glycoside hydrolase family 16 protein [Acidimicrobiales bacterium]
MRSRLTFRVLTLLALVSPIVAAGCDTHPEGYTLAFSDEFDGTQLDRSLWCTRYIYGGGPALQVPDAACSRNGDGTLDWLNDEQERYRDTNAAKEQMHVESGGILHLRATRTRPDDPNKAFYESAMIRSKQTFRPTASRSYYITARVLMPDVVGTWPAFWLNSDRRPDGSTTWPPEIDIFDGAYNGRDDRIDMLHQAAIVKGAQTTGGTTDYTFTAPGFDRTWSNYHAGRDLRGVWVEVSVEWTANNVCYFLDGVKTACENYRWVENGGQQAAPAHVLLNLAVGGSWAGRYGIDDAKFPAEFQIDWIRVYQKG